MANVTDIRTRKRLSKQTVADVVSLAARRCLERTAPHGSTPDKAHAKRCTSVSEIYHALKDGYKPDRQGSHSRGILMVKPL